MFKDGQPVGPVMRAQAGLRGRIEPRQADMPTPHRPRVTAWEGRGATLDVED